MSGRTSSERRTTLVILVLALGLLGLSTYIFTVHTPRLARSLRSLSWPTTEATILRVRLYEVQTLPQQREKTTRYMDFRFRYQVAGNDYFASRAKIEYHPSLGPPAHKTGDTFPIPYNPEDPTDVIYQRKFYDHIFVLAVGLVSLVGGVLLALIWWSERCQARVARPRDRLT